MDNDNHWFEPKHKGTPYICRIRQACLMETEGDDGHLEVCEHGVIPALLTSGIGLQQAKLPLTLLI